MIQADCSGKILMRRGDKCLLCRISYDHFSKATAVFRLILRRMAVLQEIKHNQSGFGLVFWMPGFERAWSLIQQRERYWGMQLTHYNKVEPQSSIYAHEDLSIRPSSIIEYCSLVKNLKCTDERDRVYGMLGFAYGDLDIEPDYRATPESVWEGLATRTLVKGDLTVLHYAGIPATGRTRVRSFAADFGHWTQKVTRLGGHGHPRFHAATQIPPKVGLEPDGSVRVHAIKVDTVNQVCHEDTSEDSGAETTSDQAGPLIDNVLNAPTMSDECEDDPWTALSTTELPQVLRLMYAWWISWLRAKGPRYYSEEAGELAFQRTIVTDIALPQTKELCKHFPIETLDLMFVICMLITDETDSSGQKREMVDTWEVYKWMKKPVAIGLSTFAEDPDPSIYLFPRLCGEEWLDRMWHNTLYVTGYHDLQASDEDLERLGLVQGLPPGRIMEITGPLQDQLRNYRIAINYILSERRMFFTNVRLLGIGPRAMRPGDVVMVPEGSQTPFIYRASLHPDDRDNNYTDHVRRGQLVGECYIHGLMDGDPVEKLSEDYEESHIEVILT
ncbi:hypothetical protein LTR56_002097 [Elasticomyces elasticus]|nr:hypothetical protein LTR22_012239 [Elasticomyces elasticus]KAK3658240.1 hypothetical protein LTR56_002097 [Elasticomyces elasticus]KAK4919519.1 hypothetical protein LTR49_012897 [Elasticomyces elasticus]KAK5764125.1 hypothetical protein LTS12_005819 [Elasticomyces elasticus]